MLIRWSFQPVTKPAESSRMKPARQTISTPAARKASSMAASNASREGNGLCGMTVVGTPAAAARSRA